MSAPLTDRFWSKVDKTDGCWNWTGGTNRSGYGRIRIERRDRPVHQVALEFAGIPVPEGFQPDHECKNRKCVRVGSGHPRVIPTAENLASNKCAEHDNWYTNPDGTLKCRTCRDAAKRRWYEANRDDQNSKKRARRARRKGAAA